VNILTSHEYVSKSGRQIAMQSPWLSDLKEPGRQKEGHVLRGGQTGQVPVPMFERVSQSASECCPECGQMPSLLKVERGLICNSMQIKSINLAIPCKLKKND
jgi:hypothetical protein